MNRTPTAVIAAPLDLEHRAVRDLLGAPTAEHERGGALYDVTELPGEHAAWRVVVALAGRGNGGTAAAVERAAAEWSPDVLVVVGVAGGLRGAAIGDVIAATKVYDYESGQDTDDGLLHRPESFRVSAALGERAQALARSGRWKTRLGLDPGSEAPRVHHRPVASGGKVVTGSASATAELIAATCGDAYGIETEGAGAAAAMLRHPEVAFTVVRGVSDLIDDKTKAADRTRQPLAARHAAAFALELIAQHRPGPSAPRTEEPDGDTYTGAIGNGASATIAAQGRGAKGRITINNHAGPGPAQP